MLIIYGSPLSIPTNKVIYTCNYLKLKHEFKHLNLPAWEQRQEPYLKINPLGKAPGMDEDGFTLGEGNAIINYLASKEKSPIYPTELKARALVEMWTEYATHHVGTAMTQLLVNNFWYMAYKLEKNERSIRDHSETLMKQYLPTVEKQLNKFPFVAGPNFSLADIAIVAAVDPAEGVGIDLNAFPALLALRKKLMKESWYTAYHKDYFEVFNQVMELLGLELRVKLD